MKYIFYCNDCKKDVAVIDLDSKDAAQKVLAIIDEHFNKGGSWRVHMSIHDCPTCVCVERK